MSGSDWGVITKARLIAFSVALAVAMCAVTIGWGLSKSAEYQRQADYHASQYAKYIHDYVGQGCVAMSALNKANCLAEANDRRRAYERDEQDLVAQKQSALWAYIMGAAAVVGVGLSAVGVWLVWTTFRETKVGNLLTEAALIAERRAWLKLSISASRVTARDDSVSAELEVTVQNVGNTVALNARWYAQLLITPDGAGREFGRFDLGPEPSFNASEQTCAIFPNQSVSQTREAWSLSARLAGVTSDVFHVYAVIIAEYRLAVDSKRQNVCKTRHVVELKSRNGTFRKSESSENEVSIYSVYVIASDIGGDTAT